jgi:pyruvate dehydrogenase E2 component (dihydrolipoamide acetyltransferase)
MFDIDEFTAIINPPESAILAIGKIDRVPVADGDNVVIRPIMVLSLTYDHRIIDGAPAAQFLQRVKQIMQNPYLLI